MSLPTSGPLGRREDYQPTNRDLLDNAHEQNKVINLVVQDVGAIKENVRGVDSKLQTLASTVDGHTEVIDALKSIKSTAGWILSFLGIGGLLTLLNWIKLWVDTK